jgi:hypothetical protein
MMDILYTVILTFFIMVLLHHLYNYLQTNLTVPKVNELVHPTILQDLQEVNKQDKQEDKEKDELKEYLNQFKKK